MPASGIISKIFVLRDLDLHFRFQMCKIRETRSFRMLLEAKIMGKHQQYILRRLQLSGVSPILNLRDIDQHFQFEMFKIYEIR